MIPAPWPDEAGESIPQSVWENTEAECEEWCNNKAARRRLEYKEVRSFCRAADARGLWVVVDGDYGAEWWEPMKLMLRVVHGADDFSPSLHRYELHSSRTLLQYLRSEHHRLDELIAFVDGWAAQRPPQ